MSGCWIWVGAMRRDGYGIILAAGTTVKSAHRASYGIYRGEVPADKCVLHSCDVKLCVNPHHLFLGTKKENTGDMLSKGREAKGERHGIAKLTDKDVAKIRSDARSQRAIANEYGVAQSLVSLIKAGKLWRHVPGVAAATYSC